MAIKNASASPAVQELITWYEGEIAIADRDPVSEWPWAFGRFSDGTPIEPGHRRIYRERRDLQQAFPDPYDAATGRLDLSRLVQFGGEAEAIPSSSRSAAPAARTFARLRTRVSFPMALRLLALLLLAHEAARRCAARVVSVLRREGPGRLRAAAARAARIEANVIDVIIPVYKGLRADAPLHRQRARQRAGARRSRSWRSTMRAPSPTSRAICDELAARRAHHAAAQRDAIAASSSRSIAAWRCTPTGTWSCSTATPRWRTTGWTACGDAPTP